MDERLAQLFAAGNEAGLTRAARAKPAAVLRFLAGRLYSADAGEKQRAVTWLGEVVADREVTSDERARDLLRRFFWALNDESGTVPFGVPEAIGEILARRRELQGDFLPQLCACLTHDEMQQTGPIERGILWALGRVGPPVARCSPLAITAVAAACQHEDLETARVAREALARLGSTGAPSGPTVPGSLA